MNREIEREREEGTRGQEVWREGGIRRERKVKRGRNWQGSARRNMRNRKT